MAIIYSYPEIPEVQGGDLLLISDTGAPNKPTRSVDIDDLAAYIGTVIGIGFWNLGTAPDSIFTTKMASIGQNANIASSKLNVYKTEDMTASVPHIATFNESSSNHSANLWPSPGDNAADIYGGVSRGTFTGSGTVDQIIGINPIGRHSGSGSVNFIQGVQTTASLIGSGSTKTIVASYAKTFIEGTGSNNIENAIGAWNTVGLNGLNDIDTIYGTYSNIVLTNGEVNDDAIGHYIEFEQVAANTEINNAYYIHAKNNSLSVTGEKFFIKDETGIPSQFSNKLVLNAYGSGTFTGTATQRLAVDTNGNVIEIPIGSGPVDGSGTANYTARWTDSDTLGIGALYDNGTNVGIGTTNPTQKLEVNGTVLFSTLPGNNGRLCLGDVSTNLFSNAASGHLYISTNNSSRMTILDNGNVGIGTTSPARLLHVNSSGQTDIHLTSSSQGVSSADGMTVFLDSSGSGGLWLRESQALRFATSTTERMRITSNGNVGIGTTSPLGTLHVTKDNQVYSIASSYGLYITGRTDQTNALGLGYDDGNDVAYLQSVDVGVSFNDLAINPNGGNVGIGTTSPQSKLHLATTGSSTLTIQNTTNSGNAALNFRDEGNNDQFQIYYALGANRSYNLVNGNGLTIYSSQSSSEIARFGNASSGYTDSYFTGNVGIGTTSPGEPLTVKTKTDAYFPGIKVEDYNSSMGLYVQNIEGQNSGIGTGRYYNSGSWRSDVTAPTTIRLDDGAIRFYAQSGVTADVNYTPTERMRIDSDGNVGIGTTSPTEARLVAEGTSEVIAAFGRDGTDGDVVQVYNGLAGTTKVIALGASGNDGTIYSQFGDIILQPAAGNVGIGTTNPLRKLHVSGDVEIESKIYGAATDHTYYQIASGDYNHRFFTRTSSGASLERFRVEGGADIDSILMLNSNVGIGTTSPVYKLDVNGGARAGGKVTYTKEAGSLNTTGYAVAGITAFANGNGKSCGFTFTCFGGNGKYQKLVYSCYNSVGTWNAKKVIDEGTNDLDVVASANGSTITFTFKAKSSSQSFSPKVTVEAVGTSINSTYA